MTPKKNRLVLISVVVSGILVLSGVLIATHDARNVEPVEISVTGEVDYSFNLTLDESTNLVVVTVTAELICVDGISYGTHNWTGVRLSEVLSEAGVLASAEKVGFFASDGYSTDLTLQDAARQDVIIAFEKDGAPLDEKTRLVVPGMWGYKWISGIDRIVIYDFDFLGKWERRGYPDDATIGA